MPSPQIFIDQENGLITLQNKYARYQINRNNGYSHSYVLRQSGEELLASKWHFAHFHTWSNPRNRGNATRILYHPVTDREGKLEVRFKMADRTETDLKMIVFCKAEPTHFLFELQELRGDQNLIADIGAAVMTQLTLLGDAYGDFIGAVGRDNYVTAGLALNRHTHAFSNRQSTWVERYTLRTHSYSIPNVPDFQLLGAKIVLLSCPQTELFNRIRDIARQYGLPMPAIDSVWHKQHPDVRTSYFFVDITEENHSKMIALARRGRFKHIMPYA